MNRMNFFQHAPAQDTYQKRFLESVLNKRHLIASFPVGYPMVSLYALPAMMSEGLSVVVSSNRDQIRRNLDYFKNAGLKFQEIAFLYGTQMHHEERAIHKEINHHRVRMLYITPERFVSLTFLEVLVHQPIAFLAIEEAERLLPGMPGYGAYQKFYTQGLQQLNQLPPIALMVPVMAPAQLRHLEAHLKLQDVQLLQCPPLIEAVELKVKRLFSEHQKFMSLVSFLSGSVGSRKMGRLDTPGTVMIQTALPVQAEKLGASLINYGFESVHITHFKKSQREQSQAIHRANTQPNVIVVNAGTSNLRAWMPSPQWDSKLIYWNPPSSLDELWMHAFRQPSEKQALGMQPFRVRLYHTREDFMVAMNRFKLKQLLETPEMIESMKNLKLYRNWVLDTQCRLQSAVAYSQGASVLEMPPCGRCDRCTETHDFRWKVQETFKNWLY